MCLFPHLRPCTPVFQAWGQVKAERRGPRHVGLALRKGTMWGQAVESHESARLEGFQPPWRGRKWVSELRLAAPHGGSGRR